jgi:hypothetical protein
LQHRRISTTAAADRVVTALAEQVTCLNRTIAMNA